MATGEIIQLLLGPFAALVVLLIVTVTAVRRPPAWYTPAAYAAAIEALAYEREERLREREGARKVIEQWQANAARWQELALSTTSLAAEAARSNQDRARQDREARP